MAARLKTQSWERIERDMRYKPCYASGGSIALRSAVGWSCKVEEIEILCRLRTFLSVQKIKVLCRDAIGVGLFANSTVQSQTPCAASN